MHSVISLRPPTRAPDRVILRFGDGADSRQAIRRRWWTGLSNGYRQTSESKEGNKTLTA